MPESHPDPALLERFMRNEAGPGERRAIVRHLLAGCARCAAVTRRVWNLGERRPDDPAEAARLRHLEGKIAEQQGAHGEAEAAFLDARRWFLGQGLGGEAASVLFDLAILYAREGRVAEIQGLAENLLPFFQAGDLRKGVATALVFFRQLADTGQANLEMLTEVGRYVSGGNASGGNRG